MPTSICPRRSGWRSRCTSERSSRTGPTTPATWSGRASTRSCGSRRSCFPSASPPCGSMLTSLRRTLRGEPMMPTDFDTRAETWDDESKVRRAEAVAAGMRRAVPLERSMTALEYGAGTGLLSFCLRDTLGRITLADSSAGMRAVAERKIAAAKTKQMRVVDLDLMRDAVPQDRYDLVFSMMTLHHVQDVARGLAAFHALLNRGGYLCIADLDAEDGSFHGPGVDVHHGFERGALQAALTKAGFADIAIDDCFVVEHGPHKYPVFLASCRKP